MERTYFDVVVHCQVADGVCVDTAELGEGGQHLGLVLIAVLLHQFVEDETIFHTLVARCGLIVEKENHVLRESM